MTNYPPLLKLADEAAYRARFQALYCTGTIATFDGIAVRFRNSDFDHCFFESTHRNKVKDAFSTQRAERMEWIQVALQDASADRFVGWDKNTRTYRSDRRVTVVCGNYVVVIAILTPNDGRFITAFVADTPTSLSRIKASPKWPP
jgi:hypothetical protein